jgi:hypothetical protein
MVGRGKRTVKDRTLEIRQEFEKHVLLLRHDFVEAEALATDLDIVVGDTLLDIGLEPVIGDVTLVDGATLSNGGRLLPELER